MFGDRYGAKRHDNGLRSGFGDFNLSLDSLTVGCGRRFQFCAILFGPGALQLHVDSGHSAASGWQIVARIECSQDDSIVVHRFGIVKRRLFKRCVLAAFDADNFDAR
jgi:hypothetical protein